MISLFFFMVVNLGIETEQLYKQLQMLRSYWRVQTRYLRKAGFWTHIAPKYEKCAFLHIQTERKNVYWKQDYA